MQISNVGPISDATILPKLLTILIGEQPAAKTAVMYVMAALANWLSSNREKQAADSASVLSAGYLQPFLGRKYSVKLIVRFLLRRLIFNSS